MSASPSCETLCGKEINVEGGATNLAGFAMRFSTRRRIHLGRTIAVARLRTTDCGLLDPVHRDIWLRRGQAGT
jgi:hypothetical protein